MPGAVFALVEGGGPVTYMRSNNTYGFAEFVSKSLREERYTRNWDGEVRVDVDYIPTYTFATGNLDANCRQIDRVEASNGVPELPDLVFLNQDPRANQLYKFFYVHPVTNSR